MSETRRISTILLVAFGIRLAFFAAILFLNPNQAFFDADSTEFWRIAQNLIRRHSFSSDPLPPLSPDHLRTPGYPLTLAAMIQARLGPPQIAFLQILISLATCCLSISICKQVTNDPLAQWLSGLIPATDIVSAFYSVILLTDTFFTFFLACSVYFLIRAAGNTQKMRWVVLAAAGAGFLCWYKPAGLILSAAIGFSLAISVRQYKARSVLLYSLILFLFLAPWYLRNKLVFGGFFSSTIAADDLSYRAAHLYSERNGISLGEAWNLLDLQARAGFTGDADSNPVEYSRYKMRFAASVILKDPLLYAKNHVIYTIYLLIKPLRNSIDVQLGLRPRDEGLTIPSGDHSPFLKKLFRNTSAPTLALIAIQIILIVPLWAGVLYGFRIMWNANKANAVLPAVILLAFIGLHGGRPTAYARHRVPIIPLLAVPAGIGIAGVLQKRSNRRTHSCADPN